MRRLAIVIALASCSSSAPARAPSSPPPKSPFERFDTMSPRVGELAPSFDLVDSTGTRVRLADAVARGPVVLVWGSFT